MVFQGMNRSLSAVSEPMRACSAIRNDQGFVVDKQGGDFVLVGLQLVESRPDGGVLIGGVLELDHRQRQAIDEDDHIRAAVDVVVLVAASHRKLVDRQPVVIIRDSQNRPAGPYRL